MRKIIKKYTIISLIILGICGVGYVKGEKNAQIFTSSSEKYYRSKKSDCLQKNDLEEECESKAYILTLEKYYPGAIEEYIEVEK